MISKNDFQKAIDLIEPTKNVLITTHARPDGDACGCVVAMTDALTALGKKVKPLMLSDIPQWYEFLFDQKPPILDKDISIDQIKQGELGEFDLIIILDTNSNNQLTDFAQILEQNNKPVLILDHHVTTDGLGDLELIDTSASATAVIVFELFKFAGWKINQKVANALFAAICTDTGWFQFNNTDSRSLRICAELIDAGVNPTRMYHDMYQNFSAQRFALMTAMLDSLELHFDGRYATQYLLQSDFEKTGANFNDTENLIDQCRKIKTVEVASLFVELPDNKIKVSLRSSGPVDVRKIAQKFNGGGHTKAAGIHMPAPIENAKKLIYDEVAKQLT